MAAFSYQNYHPLLYLDSIFLPNSTPPSESFTQEMLADIDAGVLESSCIDHSSSTKVATFSDNEPSVTKKQSTESSIVMDRLETGEQVTQEVTPMDKKRKNRNGSSLSSAQSKDPREYKEKKPKKLDGAKKAEEMKFKSNKKDQVKVEEPPTGYIHVRARRGQATDSHSLAERVRREKISERMKMLQRLVPGCDKVTGRAVMLDEIINYVQSLQNQVEFLSLKLASVNPLFYDFGMDLYAAQPAPMVKQERLSSMELPFPSIPQCSPKLPTDFGDTSTNNIITTTTTTFHTSNNNYPFLDSSASLILQQEQRPSAFSQDSESLLWDVEDQRQDLLSPSGFSNNLCSFN